MIRVLALAGVLIISVIWGMLIFAERLSALQWIGSGVVLGGVLFVRRESRS